VVQRSGVGALVDPRRGTRAPRARLGPETVSSRLSWGLFSFDDPVEAAHIRDRKALDFYGPYAYLNLPDDMEPHPIPPDPNHPERPVRMTGPYGYLRVPPYQPPRPDGTWPKGPPLSAIQRIRRGLIGTQNEPKMLDNEPQTAQPRTKETPQEPPTAKDTKDTKTE
jgi:hypothetical protein